MKKEVVQETSGAEREKILLFALNFYMKEGFYKTSMDTLAAELRISKKTIYKYFESKEVLVEEAVNHLMKNFQDIINQTLGLETDAVSKVKLIHEMFSRTLLRFSDKWLNDIRLHMPELWLRIDDFRTKKMFSIMSKIFEQGKKEGFFKDRPNEILITVFTASLRSIINPDFLYYNKFSYDEALSITFDILFNGILTREGEKTYKRKLKEKQNENIH